MPGDHSPIHLPSVPNFDGRNLGTNAAEMLQELGGRGRVKVAVDRAAKLAGLSYWRAYDIWYGKARRIEDFEIEKITKALGGLKQRAARNELRELKDRLARLEARLAEGDTDFYRQDVDGLGETLRARS